MGGVYCARREEARRTETQMRADLTALLAAQGVVLNPEGIPLPEERAEVHYLPRDTDREAALAALFLGAAAVPVDQGGYITLYTAGPGRMQFRGGGLFSLEYETPQAPEGDVMEDARRLLTDAGFLTRESEEPLPSLGDAGLITLPQKIAERPVWNAYVALRYDEAGGLGGVSGCWLWGVLHPAAGEPPGPSAAEALLALTDARAAAGQPLARIESARLGFFAAAVPPDLTRLAPWWRVVTDQGVFYVDENRRVRETLPI
ncbi:MAG: hypothetical protein LBC26_04405 [Oscillospiraceae bacterium]|jgi:hypothetical protein|nr:hypothetical protein [Oscillospiraceae bacterium]